MSKVLICSCVHEFQDNVHGKQKRVHNWGPKVHGSGQPGYRCTVCKDTKGE